MYRLFACLTGKGYRDAIRQLRGLRREKKAGAGRLLKEVMSAEGILRRWQTLVPGNIPVIPMELADTGQQLMGTVWKEATELAGYFSHPGAPRSRQIGPQFSQRPLEELSSTLERLRSDTGTPFRIARISSIITEIELLGAGVVFEELRRARPDPQLWDAIFRYAWLSSCLEETLAEESDLSGFLGKTHERLVREFVQLDRQRLKVNAQRTRRMVGI